MALQLNIYPDWCTATSLLAVQRFKSEYGKAIRRLSILYKCNWELVGGILRRQRHLHLQLFTSGAAAGLSIEGASLPAAGISAAGTGVLGTSVIPTEPSWGGAQASRSSSMHTGSASSGVASSCGGAEAFDSCGGVSCAGVSPSYMK